MPGVHVDPRCTDYGSLVGIRRPRDATELNNDGMIKSGTSTTKVQPNLITDHSSFCSHILLAIDLQCHLFTFEKTFVTCPSLSVNRIFDDVRHDVIST